MGAPNRANTYALAPNCAPDIDATWLASTLERLDLLVPDVAGRTPRDLQTYALAFIEKYRGDYLQLEQEREWLYIALVRAWGAAQYTTCAQLATVLAHIAGRFPDPWSAEYILRLGMEASRLSGDEACFLLLQNRLGVLLYSHGKYRQGRRMWQKSLGGSNSSGALSGLWNPLFSFTHIANMVGDYPSARLFAERAYDGGRGEHSHAHTVAVFVRGFFARTANQSDRACEDLSYSWRLLQSDPEPPLLAHRQLFTTALQTELARAQGDYFRAQQYAQSAYLLARLFADHHSTADLVIDQAIFTSQYGELRDSEAAFNLLWEMARQGADPRLSERCRLLEFRLARYETPVNAGRTSLASPPVLQPQQEALTSREIEVLRLVAQGLSNGDIARRLVVTTATVKKHLEHVYDKIGTHSRTAALARARTLKILQ